MVATGNGWGQEPGSHFDWLPWDMEFCLQLDLNEFRGVGTRVRWKEKVPGGLEGAGGAF